MNRNNCENEQQRNDNSWSWAGVAAAAAGITALAGGLYLATRSSNEESTESSQRTEETKTENRRYSVNDLFSSLSRALESNSPVVEESIPRSSIPSRPNISNLNSLLADIYVRYVALKREDFQLHYRVFTQVFDRLQRNMKAVDSYYERYSSNVQFAGSHFDGLRIKKPDEFDMDIVIGLPVNHRINPLNPSESDIVIEPRFPGYVQLRAGVQYQNIMMRDGADCLINKTAYKWMDDRHYILRSKFIAWFQSVGNRALNNFENSNGLPGMIIDGVWYSIRTSSSGPAWTIKIQAFGFNLDVDLVPAIKFPEQRWNLGKDYKPIPIECTRGYWMVVPKPNKNGDNSFDESRSWRIALQDQEKKFMYNLNQLKTIIRLMKKLRDELDMHKIASYYIKTLFFWEIQEKRLDPAFWSRHSLEFLLKHMLRKLLAALEEGVIPYYWNKKHNLIAGINSYVLAQYQNKILEVIQKMEDVNNYKQVAAYFLSSSEYQEYREILYQH